MTATCLWRLGLFLGLFSFSWNTLIAQYSEVSIGLGTSNYLGDLVPPRTYFLGTNVALGGHYHYHFTPRWSVRGSITWGQLSGDDVNSSYDSGRRQRNLNFQSPLLEGSAMVQFFVLPFEPSRDRRPISPYGFIGVGVFHFNPYTLFKNKRVYLQPLGTEGQGIKGFPEKYSLWELSIPFGGGVQFNLGGRFNLAVELGARKTFTDYIDDVSGPYINLNTLREGNGQLAAALSNRTYASDGQQIELEGAPRGNIGKDWYLISQVRLSYTLQRRYYFKTKRKKRRRAPTNQQDRSGNGKWM